MQPCFTYLLRMLTSCERVPGSYHCYWERVRCQSSAVGARARVTISFGPIIFVFLSKCVLYNVVRMTTTICHRFDNIIIRCARQQKLLRYNNMLSRRRGYYSAYSTTVGRSRTSDTRPGAPSWFLPVSARRPRLPPRQRQVNGGGRTLAYNIIIL